MKFKGSSVNNTEQDIFPPADLCGRLLGCPLGVLQVLLSFPLLGGGITHRLLRDIQQLHPALLLTRLPARQRRSRWPKTEVTYKFFLNLSFLASVVGFSLYTEINYIISQ